MSGATTAIGRVLPPSRARRFIRRLTSGDEIAHLITLTFGASILLITGLKKDFPSATVRTARIRSASAEFFRMYARAPAFRALRT